MTIQNNIIRALLISTALLIVPITASFFVDGWLWTFFDYIFAWVLFSLVSIAITFALSSARATSYKVAATLAVVAMFLLIWINAAVGIIGDGDFPNAMYFGVLAIGFTGALIARFEPRGMSRALLVMAFAQFLVPVVALAIWPPATTSWSPGVVKVFCLNGFFVALFVGSSSLFRRASYASSGRIQE